jgi:uncharacterized protein YoaH (UPF0181 family)
MTEDQDSSSNKLNTGLNTGLDNKPKFQVMPSTKKTRADDRRGANHKHPISQPKATQEEKTKFSLEQFKPKWATHPIKQQILIWIEAGFGSTRIMEKINLKAIEDGVPPDTYSMSLPTITKIRRRHLYALGALTKEESQSRVTVIAEKEHTDAEQVLWNTVKECTEKKKDTTISPKDWQYYDQQQQNAISLINQLKSEGKTGEDISVVISRVFAQFFKQFNATPQGTQSLPAGTADDVGPSQDKPL